MHQLLGAPGEHAERGMGGVAAIVVADGITPLTVAGLGSRLGRDDAVGLELVESLPPIEGVRTVLWEDSDALTVAGRLLDVEGSALIVDCAEMGLPPGASRCVDAGEAALVVRGSPISVHGLGLAEAVALSRDLGFLGRLAIFGVQPFDLDPGCGLSPGLAALLPELSSALEDAVRRLLEEARSGRGDQEVRS